ncbi:hypothetical protein SGPA1_50941 [Streptomyces misionensis JCM 4497]
MGRQGPAGGQGAAALQARPPGGHRHRLPPRRPARPRGGGGRLHHGAELRSDAGHRHGDPPQRGPARRLQGADRRRGDRQRPADAPAGHRPGRGPSGLSGDRLHGAHDGRRLRHPDAAGGPAAHPGLPHLVHRRRGPPRPRRLTPL